LTCRQRFKFRPGRHSPAGNHLSRAIILGLLGVGFINSLAPFNDYVLSNTYLVDSHLPTGLLFFFAAFVMVINGPLNRFFPRLTFSRGSWLSLYP